MTYYDNILNYSNFQTIDIDIFVHNFYFLELHRIEILINSEDEFDTELKQILFYANNFNPNYDTYISEIIV